jgi:hypothetical protein
MTLGTLDRLAERIGARHRAALARYSDLDRTCRDRAELPAHIRAARRSKEGTR